VAHDAASKMTEIAQLDAAVQDAVTHVSTRMKTRLRPVDRKVFAVIHSRLLEVKEGLSRDPSHCRIHADKILSTVQLVNESLVGDAAWDVSDSLKELLPLITSDDWVYRALLEEKGRLAEAPYGWKALSSEAKLDTLIEDYDGSLRAPDGIVARQNLTALYGIRNDRGRHERAREGLRAELGTSRPWSPIIIVFFAGGLGAVWIGFGVL
jgi:hypothetical protein